LSYSCIKTHHKCFLAYIFKHSDQNDLIFSVISKTFWSMTEKKTSFSVSNTEKHDRFAKVQSLSFSLKGINKP